MGWGGVTLRLNRGTQGLRVAAQVPGGHTRQRPRSAGEARWKCDSKLE
jgi:hypothetical protein